MKLGPILLALGILFPASDAAALRVMTYNLLNYSGGRDAEFRTVLEVCQPDVLVVQEILSTSAVNTFRNNVLNVVNPGEWAAGPFVNGPDTDNGAFYRTTTVDTVTHVVITTALRDIDEYTFRPATHTTSAADVRVYVFHLKASQGTDNQQKRLAEVTLMRARMETFPPGGNYFVTGDANIYTATEPAYQYMINPSHGLAGVVQDPIAREGNWHDNPSFADVHTQSPRTTQFGGGAPGGLDDRFDLILVGPSLQDGEGFDLIDGTYTALGQDGMHFNGALNTPPYTVIDSTTAEAIHYASDHLPVFVDVQNFSLFLADASVDFGAVIVGGTATSTLMVENGSPPPADDLDYSFAAPPGFDAPPGAFSIEAGAPASFHELSLDTSAPWLAAGDLVATTDDPDRPAHPIPLTGVVLDHAQPSLAGGSIVLLAELDAGIVAEGDSAFADATVHNFDAGVLRANLEVHGFELTGDAGFFLDGFAPATIGTEPVAWSVGFDATGAALGAHEGTLVFHTRDQQDLSGAIVLADVQYDLSVTVVDPTGVVPALAIVERTGFVAVAPNPFDAGTELRFAVRDPLAVSLRIYDVTGRAVRTLTAGSFPAGEHRTTWDGRDDTGNAQAPGVYFARFVAGGTVDVRKLLRIR